MFIGGSIDKYHWEFQIGKLWWNIGRPYYCKQYGFRWSYAVYWELDNGEHKELL